MDNPILQFEIPKLDTDAMLGLCMFLRELVCAFESHCLERLQRCHHPDFEHDDPPF
jgi:hypothetical protein